MASALTVLRFTVLSHISFLYQTSIKVIAGNFLCFTQAQRCTQGSARRTPGVGDRMDPAPRGDEGTGSGSRRSTTQTPLFAAFHFFLSFFHFLTKKKSATSTVVAICHTAVTTHCCCWFNDTPSKSQTQRNDFHHLFGAPAPREFSQRRLYAAVVDCWRCRFCRLPKLR